MFNEQYTLGEVLRWYFDLHATRKRVVRALSLKGRVLDYGCGTGFYTKLLTNEVVGYDTSHSAIEFAKRYNDAPNITYTEMLPSENFDTVFFNCSLEYMPEWRKVLARYAGCNVVIVCRDINYQPTLYDRIVRKLHGPYGMDIVRQVEGDTSALRTKVTDFDPSSVRAFKTKRRYFNPGRYPFLIYA
jgi:SAM-dependent methyltransferase